MERAVYQRVKVEAGLYLFFIGGIAGICTYAGRPDGTRLNLSEDMLYSLIKKAMYGH